MREQDFRLSRRRNFDDASYHPRPRAFGGRPRFDQTRFEAPSGPPVRGTVKWFNPDKGFGFAVAEDGEKDVFIHISVVEKAGMRALGEGQRVSMRVVKTQKGREAISLALID